MSMNSTVVCHSVSNCCQVAWRGFDFQPILSWKAFAESFREIARRLSVWPSLLGAAKVLYLTISYFILISNQLFIFTPNTSSLLLVLLSAYGFIQRNRMSFRFDIFLRESGNRTDTLIAPICFNIKLQWGADFLSGEYCDGETQLESFCE